MAPISCANAWCGLRQVDAYFELFNPNGVMGAGTEPVLERAGAIFGHKIESARDPDLVRLFRQEPVRGLGILNDIAEMRQRKCISYKIFPNQLQMPVIEQIVDHDGVFVILLSRTRLDVYISYLKARQTNVWKNTPTHELDCTVDVDDFLSWAAEQDSWFERCAELVGRSGRPSAVLDYGEDIDVGKHGLMTHLKQILAEVGTKVSFNAEADTARFQRQDARVSPFLKISNGAEVEAELRRRDKYDYALDAPLSAHRAAAAPRAVEAPGAPAPEPAPAAGAAAMGGIAGMLRRIFRH